MYCYGFDPNWTGSKMVLSNSNKTVILPTTTHNTQNIVRSNFILNLTEPLNKKLYYEVLIEGPPGTGASSLRINTGIMSESVAIENKDTRGYITNYYPDYVQAYPEYSLTNGYAYAYYPCSGEKSPGTKVYYGADPYSVSSTVGDVIGVGVNFSDRSIEFFKNGTSMGTAFSGIQPAKYYPAVGIHDWSYGPAWQGATIRFGLDILNLPPGYQAMGSGHIIYEDDIGKIHGYK